MGVLHWGIENCVRNGEEKLERKLQWKTRNDLR